MKERTSNRRVPKRRFAMVTAAMAALAAMLLLLTAPGGTTPRREVSKKAMMGQIDADGDRMAMKDSRAIVTRSDSWVKVDVLLPTPKPGSYTYPDASTAAPPGSFHPEVVSGSPEVYTLWMFQFQNPELCSDGECGANDLGDTPAKGGVYQVDATIADGPWIHMHGVVVNGQGPKAFLPMTDASTTEIHVAIAPHGAAYDDPASLLAQMNVAVGTPGEWFFGGVHLPNE